MIRKLCMSLIVVAGLFWLAGAFALHYPAKTQAVDELTNALRPAFTDAALEQSQNDVRTAASFATDFQGEAVPRLAQQLAATPAEFLDRVATQYPAVGDGLVQLPESLRYFDGVQHTMQAQQANFHEADAVPTKGLPNTTVHWLFVVLGAGAVAVGVLGLLLARRAVAAIGATFGVIVIATTLVLSVPTKTAAVDDLTVSFRPLFTEQGAAQARGYVETLNAMGEQLTAEALPAIAGMLDVTPERLGATLAHDVPTVATGLQQLPAILARLDGLVSVVEANVHNFQLADSMPTEALPTTAVAWQLVLPAAILIVAGAVGAASGTRRVATVEADETDEIAAREFESLSV
ncbi:MAG TPA: hypothetical protein VFH30_00145 [Acidimicrobiales bacterium]|nr:hypothetical protein [Acidimicrobiales bacterium]